MGRNPNAPTTQYFIPGSNWMGRPNRTSYYKLENEIVFYSDDYTTGWARLWRQGEDDIFFYASNHVLQEIPECTIPQHVKERKNSGA